jgi:acyl-CoA dehydrogenase
MLRHAVAEFVPGDDRTAAGSFQSLVNSLKLIGGQQCWIAVNEMIDLVGLKNGYMVDSPLRLERTLRDLRSASLNFSDDKLRLANGSLAMLDMGVHLA